jgi:hypothetical protein
MKITKRQLRRIIKEEISEQTHRGNPNKPWDAVFPPGDDSTPAPPKMIEAVKEAHRIAQDTLGPKGVVQGEDIAQKALMDIANALAPFIK